MKNNTGGVGAVFRYTVQQHYKTTSVRIFLIVLFVLAVAAFPLIRLLSGSGSSTSDSSIKTVYVHNETAFTISQDELRKDERFKEVTLNEYTEDKDSLRQKLHDDNHAVAVFLKEDQAIGGYRVQTYYGEGSKVSEIDASNFNDAFSEALHQAMLHKMNTTQEQLDLLNSKVVSQIMTMEEFNSGETDSIDASTHMFINYFYSYAVMIIITLAMSYIFQQCMEEKVSKLVESLLVSVKPSTLLTGKILAVTVFIFGGILLIIGGLVISYFIAKATGDVSFIKEGITKIFNVDLETLHLGFGLLLLTILSVLFAYFIGAFFSGIVGSCCSKTEDTQQASVAVMLFLMIGVFTSFLTPQMQSDAVNCFTSLFPITSIFCALPNYLCGKITLVILLLALLIQALTVFLFAKLAGAVYRMMLLYRGGFPKPAQLIKMLRENRSPKSSDGKEA